MYVCMYVWMSDQMTSTDGGGIAAREDDAHELLGQRRLNTRATATSFPPKAPAQPARIPAAGIAQASGGGFG